MKIHPLGDRVLICPEQVENKVGGIIIPDNAKEKPMTGTIVEVPFTCATELKEGNKVLFNKYAGQEVEHDGVKHLLMKIEDVIAYVE